tara:strand:+ start:854 stop:1441 length:588 start_codon:yes stop_codon:yes gene_type:complete
MTAKIKLNAASGGGSVSLQAPSSSSNDRIITLPDIANGTLLTNQSTEVGKHLQTVQTIKNDSFSTSSTSYVDITGFSVSITPSQASSKILLLNCCGISTTGGSSVIYMNLLRGSTAIAQPSQSTGFSSTATIYPESVSNMESWSFHFLDTPTYTLGDTITYKWQTKGYTATQYINNRNGNDIVRVATMIAIEVGA